MNVQWGLWAGRAGVLLLLQLPLLWPVLHRTGASPAPQHREGPVGVQECPLGSFETPVPIGPVDYVKKLHVEPVVHIEGPDALEVRLRLQKMMPRIRDEMRSIVARQDYLDVATLQARDRMSLLIQRTVERIVGDDEVREVYFEKYELR